MLTFVAITTIVNLALGYGLAIYLGHARRDLPGIVHLGQSPIDLADSPPTTPPMTSDVATTPPSATLASGLAPPSLPGIPAPKLPGLVSPLQNSGPQDSTAEKSLAEIAPVKDPTVNQKTDNFEQAAARVEMPERARAADKQSIESLPTPSETSNIADANNPIDDPNRQVLAADQTPVDNSVSQPPSEEDLLAGIAAFRAQLSSVNPSTESADQDRSRDGVDTSAPPIKVPG